MTKGELKKLEDEVDRLDSLRHEQERAREKLIEAAVSGARRRAEKDTEPQKRVIDDTRKAEAEARVARDAARVAYANEHDSEGPKIGTTLVEWTHGYGFSAHLRKTGRIGVVQVWDDKSAHNPNMRWSLPRVGEKYVRALKKDGSQSINFGTLNGLGNYWHPLGWEPDPEKKQRGRF